MTPAFEMTINGCGVAGAARFDVINPATGVAVGRAPDCSKDQLDDAFSAARAAFPIWRAKPLEDRQAAMAGIAARIFEHADELSQLLTSEQGKPLADSAQEILAAGYWCQAASGWTLPIEVNEDSDQRRSETHRVPIGVVVAIAPWNFPVALAMFKLAPALLAGNTLVLKPSPLTPLTTLRIGELIRDLLPPGVLNIVCGSDQLGPWMTTHPAADKVSFTGSTATGRRVMASAGTTLKRVTLELGGNDPAIVLPDVDVTAAAQKLFWSAFRNSGQLCVATKRLYVHDAIYDAFAAALVAYAKTVKVGNGTDEGVQLGPIQNAAQYQRVLDLIEDSRANGHRFLLGGPPFPRSAGYFVPVTIIDNPPETSRIVREEQFGPVLPLLRYFGTDEVVARANASPFGLAASVWSSDTGRALEIARRLECGTVWINESQYLSPGQPFGGHKQSGIGVENGLDGLLEYTNTQVLVVNKSAAA